MSLSLSASLSHLSFFLSLSLSLSLSFSNPHKSLPGRHDRRSGPGTALLVPREAGEQRVSTLSKEKREKEKRLYFLSNRPLLSTSLTHSSLLSSLISLTSSHLHSPPPPTTKSPDLHPAHPGRPRRHPLLPGPLRPRLRGRVAFRLGRHQAARLARPAARRPPSSWPFAHFLPGERRDDGDEASVPEAAGAASRVRRASSLVPRVRKEREFYFFFFSCFREVECRGR